MKIKTKKVSSPAELEKALRAGYHEFAIILSGGYCFSRKEIARIGAGKYRVHNCIDETTQVLTARTILDTSRTNIGTAMQCGAFVCIKN